MFICSAGFVVSSPILTSEPRAPGSPVSFVRRNSNASLSSVHVVSAEFTRKVLYGGVDSAVVDDEGDGNR